MSQEKVIRVELPYKPHQSQFRVHKALDSKDIVVLAAGRRFGKTLLALSWMIQRAIQAGEYSRVWYIGPTYKQAKNIAWKLLKRMVPKELIDGKPNNTELTIELVGERELSLKGAEDPDNLKGVGLDGVVFDEYAKMSPLVWDEAIEPTLVDRHGKALFIGTPKIIGPHFRQLFDWAKKGGEYGEATAFHFNSDDNPFLDKNRIRAVKDKFRKKGKLFLYQQEYEASFENAKGTVYPQFKRSYFKEGKTGAGHMVEPFEIPSHWTCYVGCDPHDQTPSAFIIGSVSPDNILYIWKDYFLGEMTVPQICSFIKREHPNIYQVFGDSAVFKTCNTYQVGDSAGRQYAKNGIHIIPVSKDLRDGHSKVREWLQFDGGSPAVLFFDSLQYLPDQLQYYVYADTEGEDDEDRKEKVSQKGKHFPDCLRYLIMGSPCYRLRKNQAIVGQGRGVSFEQVMKNVKEVSKNKPKVLRIVR